jgi:hypothetical protein
MKSLFVSIMVVSMLLVWGGGTVKGEAVGFPTFKEVPAEAWKALGAKKIYFGHQSVGDNIIQGMVSIKKKNPFIKLEIVSIKAPENLSRPGFYHSYVGKNDDPSSKVQDLKNYVENGIGNSADIAFFKFCFWDIREKVDVAHVFDEYRTTLSALKIRYPRTTFSHVTVPLMSYADGIKDRVQRAFGVPSEFDKDHVKRHKLNELILNEYLNREPLFDMALVESTLPDGSRVGFSTNGKTYYTLASEYTRDGGHLNDHGQERVAEQFLIFLARVAAKGQS